MVMKNAFPMTHSQIWNAIDALAAHNGLTPSGLARRAGLDPTTFNKSKRQTDAGRQRWPSTESIAKILQAMHVRLDDFAALMAAAGYAPRWDEKTVGRAYPIVGVARESSIEFFGPSGTPAVADKGGAIAPAIVDDEAFALEIADNSLEPVYRAGDILLVSPRAAARPGDRVVHPIISGSAN